MNPKRKGFFSFVSFASETRPSPFPSEGGNTSKTIISKSLESKGSSNRATNPGFNTAQTYKTAQRQFHLRSKRGIQ